jgi:hypothetical protein
MCHKAFLLRDHLHKVLLFDDNCLMSSSRRTGIGDGIVAGGGASSVILILIFIPGIFSDAVESNLIGDLHDELVTT